MKKCLKYILIFKSLKIFLIYCFFYLKKKEKYPFTKFYLNQSSIVFGRTAQKLYIFLHIENNLISFYFKYFSFLGTIIIFSFSS